MRISTRGRYALRGLIDVMKNGQVQPVRLQDIAERENIALSYLEQLFNKLKNAKIVKSIRGPHGGYKLSRTPDKIKVSEVIVAVEGKISPVQCTGMEKDKYKCGRRSKCTTQFVWDGLLNVIQNYLEGITLKDIAVKNKIKIKPVKNTKISAKHNFVI